MIDRDHPAVEAARSATLGPPDDNQCWLSRTVNAALPHLTADDLRHTPGGRALMAEAWEEGALHQARGSAETRRVLASALPNPYKETPND